MSDKTGKGELEDGREDGSRRTAREARPEANQDVTMWRITKLLAVLGPALAVIGMRFDPRGAV